MADGISPPLVLEGVSYRYPAAKAAADDAVSRGVEGVSLSLAAGEALGLLGPNGSGKSTILSLVAGLLAPRSGSVRLLGEPVSAHVRRRLGVVFQEPSLDPLMTVAETLRLHGLLFGLGGADLRRRSDDLLARMGLAERAGDRVETLSGGLRRRLELARALLHAPRCCCSMSRRSASTPTPAESCGTSSTTCAAPARRCCSRRTTCPRRSAPATAWRSCSPAASSRRGRPRSCAASCVTTPCAWTGRRRPPTRPRGWRPWRAWARCGWRPGPARDRAARHRRRCLGLRAGAVRARRGEPHAGRDRGRPHPRVNAGGRLLSARGGAPAPPDAAEDGARAANGRAS